MEPVCLFQDSEFELACKELYEPQIEGWEFFVESHGVTIYRQYNEVNFFAYYSDKIFKTVYNKQL